MANTNTIDKYLASFTGETKKRLNTMRAIIKKNAPLAEEAIAYGIPTFRMNGNLVHFAGFKGHMGFYPTSSGINAFKKQLSKYEYAKGSVQFPWSKPLPAGLIAKIVRFRVQENMAHAPKKPLPNKKIAAGVVHTVPPDLKKILLADGKALRIWEKLTPLSRNEWICWVDDAKKPETRRSRIERVRTELKEGIRRPCCWPGCPHRVKNGKGGGTSRA